MKHLFEKLIPIMIISSYNKSAKTPGYIVELFRITTKHKVYVIGKKIKTVQDKQAVIV
jgi:hypothetical protein